ncbi:MAG: hypothetical protein ACQ9MH_26425, partial [Nitrospinales bacterium]
ETVNLSRAFEYSFPKIKSLKHIRKFAKYPINKIQNTTIFPAIIPALGQVVIFCDNLIIANILHIFEMATDFLTRL